MRISLARTNTGLSVYLWAMSPRHMITAAAPSSGAQNMYWRQRVVQHRRVEDLVDGNLLAAERIRVQRAVAEVLVGHPGQRLLRDAVLVDVVVGLHAEELGGDELAVLGVPLRQRELGGIVGEGAAGVLVQPDRDADVVLAEPDGVGGLLDRRRRGGAGVEHVGEGDAGQADEPGHGVGVGDLVAAAEAELDVLPVDAGVGEREIGSRRRPSPWPSCRTGRTGEGPRR